MFVVVPLTQNFPPLEMERSKGVYYHPYFLTFTWNLCLQLHRQPTGCSVGDTVVNHMLYADDIVLFAPSAKGLQKLLDLVTHTAATMTLNLTLQNLVSCTLTPEKLVMRKV